MIKKIKTTMSEMEILEERGEEIVAELYKLTQTAGYENTVAYSSLITAQNELNLKILSLISSNLNQISKELKESNKRAEKNFQDFQSKMSEYTSTVSKLLDEL